MICSGDTPPRTRREDSSLRRSWCSTHRCWEWCLSHVAGRGSRPAPGSESRLSAPSEDQAAGAGGIGLPDGAMSLRPAYWFPRRWNRTLLPPAGHGLGNILFPQRSASKGPASLKRHRKPSLVAGALRGSLSFLTQRPRPGPTLKGKHPARRPRLPPFVSGWRKGSPASRRHSVGTLSTRQAKQSQPAS